MLLDQHRNIIKSVDDNGTVREIPVYYCDGEWVDEDGRCYDYVSKNQAYWDAYYKGREYTRVVVQETDSKGNTVSVYKMIPKELKENKPLIKSLDKIKMMIGIE